MYPTPLLKSFKVDNCLEFDVESVVVKAQVFKMMRTIGSASLIALLHSWASRGIFMTLSLG